MSADTFIAITAFLLLMALGSLLLRLTATHRQTLRFQVRIFMIAITLRFAASLALYQFGLWTMLGDADASGWGYGLTLANQWEGSRATLMEVLAAWGNAFRYTGATGELGHSSHLGYYYLLGTAFFATGVSSRLLAAALNCFFGALIVIFAYRTARTLFSEWVAQRVAWWTCLFPSMIIWSAQTVKEPVVILLEVIALYCCLRMRQTSFVIRYIALCGAAIAAVFPFRFYAAYIGLAAFAVVLVMPSGTSRAPRWSAFGLAAFLATFALVAFVLANSEARIEQFDLDFVQQFRHDIAEGSGSGVALDVDMHTSAGFSVGTLVGAAHLLLAPFPWQLGAGSLRMALTTPELFYWWWLFAVGIVPGIRYAVRERAASLMPVWVFVIGLGLLYSMTFGNVGLVFRQRVQLLPWLFIFAAVGLEHRAWLLSWRRTGRMPPPQSYGQNAVALVSQRR